MKKTYIKSILVPLFIGISFVSYSQIINTIAGNGMQGFSGDGGPAIDAELSNPFGISVDIPGNVYVADYSNNRIRKVNTSGVISTIAGNGINGFSGDGGLATAAELWSPYGVTEDTSGNIYIADYLNERIRKVNLSGIISTIAGNGHAGFSGDGGPATNAELYLPTDVAVDVTGNIYIADNDNNRIRKIDTSGTIITIAGDASNGYSGDGVQATTSSLTYPYGVAVDDSGNVYIADDGNLRIRKVNTSGIINTIAGNGYQGYSGDGGPATDAELSSPSNVMFDASGNIFISDDGNQRIREVTTSGIINTFAGNGISGFSGDGGPATAAEFYNPENLTLDNSGNVYVIDNGNSRIRKITATETTGINNLSQVSDELNIYPVPNTGCFTITGISQAQKIEIYNYTGQKVYASTQPPPTGGAASFACQINISSLPDGIYLVRVLNQDGSIFSTKKIVKTE
jgi:trimeric autotransporter adhesin